MHKTYQMKKKILQTISYFAVQPRLLFLLDGSGALISAGFLWGVLGTWPSFFGMPQRELFVLTGIALVLALYSFTCAVFTRSNQGVWLRIIATANSLYCLLTLYLTIHWLPDLSVWAVLYFGQEMVLILSLVFLETRVAAYKTGWK